MLTVVVSLVVEGSLDVTEKAQLGSTLDIFAKTTITPNKQFKLCPMSKRSASYVWLVENQTACCEICTKIFVGVHPEVSVWVWYPAKNAAASASSPTELPVTQLLQASKTSITSGRSSPARNTAASFAIRRRQGRLPPSEFSI